MEANELRIGNYVTMLNFVTDKVIEKQFDYDDFEAMVHQNHLLYNPIALTEDWLIKLGFEIDWVISHKHEYFNMQQLRHEYFYTADLHHHTSIEIEYVHQLQNLFFAITGRDLTVSS